MGNRFRLKRVYAAASVEDGRRVLVDRLWPRGLTKERARVDVWMKEIAPSTELRRWFGHEAGRWAEFERRYRAELKENAEAVERLKGEAKEGPVTLLFGAKDEEHNEAVVLAKVLGGGRD